MITDCWKGTFSHEKTIDLTDLNQLISAMESLDGNKKTLVSIEVNEHLYISIGGGNEDNYVVTGNRGDKIYNLLCDEHHIKDDTLIPIVAGGQEGLFEGKYCLSKKTAYQAMIFFFERNEFDAQLNWETL